MSATVREVAWRNTRRLAIARRARQQIEASRQAGRPVSEHLRTLAQPVRLERVPR